MVNLQIGSSGPEVMKIQAVLSKMGYPIKTINGIYGESTENAVRQFQKDFDLKQDGVVGPLTYKILDKYMLGYTPYSIKQGDTLYGIAQKFNTDVDKIITANPSLDTQNLKPERTIIVPFSTDVVDTNVKYTYEIMEKDILGLEARYPFIHIGIAGKSVLGRNLYYIKLGNGQNEVFYNGSHHALEWITSLLLMKFVENYSDAYTQKTKINGYDIREIFSRSTIYIIPMVNPDGVDLVINGLKKDNPFYYDLIKWNRDRDNFSSDWQANIRGVDLNHNYNASWELSKQAEQAYGVYGPGPTRYGGPYPVSEPETQAMVQFTNYHDFSLAIAYHSQGRVIYWKYLNDIPENAYKIAKQFASLSGYGLSETSGITSYAGYKDWFIKDTRKPGYTIEVGKGKNPLPLSQFDTIYRSNINILLSAPTINL